MMGVFLVVATATILKCHWLHTISILPYPRYSPHIYLLGSQGIRNITDNFAWEALLTVWVNDREGNGVSGVSDHGPVAPVPTEYVSGRVPRADCSTTNQPSSPPWRVSRPPFSLGVTW